MDKLLFLFQITLISSLLVSSHCEKIDNGKALETYLCSPEATLPPDTDLIIVVPILEISANVGFCLVENTTRITIAASPDLISKERRYVTIHCNGSTGFGFFNVTNLAIESVYFENCETSAIPASALRYINGSGQFIYYDDNAKASLIFNHCYNLALYNVLAMHVFGANLCGVSTITTTKIEDGDHQDVQALIYYIDTELVDASSVECKMDISSNMFSTEIVKSVLYHLYDRKPEMINISASSYEVSSYKDYGLSICLAQQSFRVLVNANLPSKEKISQKLISVLIVFLNGYTGSKVIYQGYPLDDCTNYSGDLMPVLFGAAFINLDYEAEITDSEVVDQLLITNTAFTNDFYDYDRSDPGTRGLFTIIFASITPNLAKMENVAICKGSLYPIRSNSIDMLLYALSYQGLYIDKNISANLIMSNISILDRYLRDYFSQTPGMDLMTFESIDILLTGNNYFNSSGGGAAIRATESNVTITGNLTIVDDYLYTSNGIVLEFNSTLYLKEHLTATFYNYRANIGSAINAIYDTSCYDFNHIEVIPPQNLTYNNLTNLDIGLYFMNSTDAGINTQIYAPKLSFLSNDFTLCQHETWDSDRLQYECTTVIDALFKKISDYDKYTSLANGLCVQLAGRQEWACYYIDYRFHTKNHLDDIQVNPGGIAFGFDTTDTRLNYSFTDVDTSNKFCFNPADIRSDSVISYKIYACVIGDYKPRPVKVIVSSMKNDSENPLTLDSVFLIHINSSCPTGFEMHKGEYCHCECVCTEALNSSFKCDIATNLFTPLSKYWTGVDKDNDTITIRFSPHCPPLYCNENIGAFSLDDDLDSLSCNKNRSGILCGQCKNNHSAVLGSYACYFHCSNLYLLTLPVYALAGLLLVVVLFALRLTVATGTINGVIFYANILGLVMDVVSEFDGEGLFLIVMRNIIYLLNLKLGFPVCLYDGMSPTAAIGFQFVFPVYLWSLVIGMVILSRCSTKLAKLISKSSVQVLATLFYFSFSSLLRTVIDIFTPTTLQLTVYNRSNNTYESGSQTVWYYSGLEYGRNIHMLYIALAAIFVILYLLPFTIFTTFSHSLLRFRLVNKLRPFIEAYGGPFKDKWRLWFGLRLWITVALFSASSGLQGFSIDTMMIVYLVVLGAFIFLQAFIQPFKNILTGTLDIFYMLNLLITIEFYLLLKGSFVLYYKIFLGLGILSLFLTLLHHITSMDVVKQFFANMKPNCFDRNRAQGYEAIGEDEQNDLLFDAERRREI